MADGELLASQVRWKRDAAVGGLAGLVAMGASFGAIALLSAAGDPDGNAALAACILGTVPGIAIGNGVGLLLMALTGGTPGVWVMNVLYGVCNAGAYAATWVVLRRTGGNAKMLKVIVLVPWAIWFGIVLFITLVTFGWSGSAD